MLVLRQVHSPRVKIFSPQVAAPQACVVLNQVGTESEEQAMQGTRMTGASMEPTSLSFGMHWPPHRLRDACARQGRLSSGALGVALATHIVHAGFQRLHVLPQVRHDLVLQHAG